MWFASALFIGSIRPAIKAWMLRPIACYREFAPCDALRSHVSSFFSFVPGAADRAAHRRLIREIAFADGDSFSSPLFADGHVSLTLNLDRVCLADGRWLHGVAPVATVIGAMSVVGPERPAGRAEMVGAYFRPGRAAPFLGAPSRVVTDRIVALEDLWGPAATDLSGELCDMDEAARIDRLERTLLERLARARAITTSVDAVGLAQRAIASAGAVTVERMADDAGVSRQALTRAFRETVGVPPKLYCMLARFQAGLRYAGRGKDVDWARAAVDLGYADQSHMIMEFRRFSSLTPYQLASEHWFHPFIERARARDRFAAPVDDCAPANRR
jgi:AraC-like DNA-binding protein